LHVCETHTTRKILCERVIVCNVFFIRYGSGHDFTKNREKEKKKETSREVRHREDTKKERKRKRKTVL
jgi:hypothetical protein